MNQVDKDNLQEILARLNDHETFTETDLDRLYRRLVKLTHPDLVGGDGSAFVMLHDRFADLREVVRGREQRRRLFGDLDPWRIIREVGAEDTLNERAALWVALERFLAVGLHRRKVRNRESLRRRNEAIIRTVLYWADRYDREFMGIFSKLLRQPVNFSLTEREGKLYFMARRVMLKGIDWFLIYQDSGRPATRDIARDTLAYVHVLCRNNSRDLFETLRQMSAWFTMELERPSSRIGLR